MTNFEGSPPLIVLIEDNLGDVRMIREALKEQGKPHQLEVFKDGELAIRFFAEQQVDSVNPRPCVIVIDLHLPKVDGLEVLRAIKREPRFAHVYVAILTSFSTPHDEHEVRLLGVQLYRQKPSDLDAFLSIGAEIMELCRQGVAGKNGAVT